MARSARFPFTLPAVAALEALELDPEVTFLVGENGSGKSTLLEAIAAKLDLDVEGGDRDLRFDERAADTRLHEALRRVRGPRPPSMRYFLRAETSSTSPGRSTTTRVAGRLRRQAAAPHVARRVVPRAGQRALLSRGLFLIATHSPLLLAYPGALIYELRPEGPVPTAYGDTDHYRLTRAFLNAPDRFLRDLFA